MDKPPNGVAGILEEFLSLPISKREPIVELVAGTPAFAEQCRESHVTCYWAFGLTEADFSTWAARFPEYGFCVGRLADLAAAYRGCFALAVGPTSGLCDAHDSSMGCQHLADMLGPSGHFLLFQRPSYSVEGWRHLRASLSRSAIVARQRRLADGVTEIIVGQRVVRPSNAR
jgi:hypothetical protein